VQALGRRHLGLALFLSLVCAPMLVAETLRVERADTSAFPEIVIDVVPLDSKNLAIPGLRASDFAVSEDGTAVRISSVTPLAELPPSDRPRYP